MQNQLRVREELALHREVLTTACAVSCTACARVHLKYVQQKPRGRGDLRRQ